MTNIPNPTHWGLSINMGSASSSSSSGNTGASLITVVNKLIWNKIKYKLKQQYCWVDAIIFIVKKNLVQQKAFLDILGIKLDIPLLPWLQFIQNIFFCVLSFF